MTAVMETEKDESLPPALALAFAPLHKRAFGIAIGLACGLTIFLLTAVYLLRDPGYGVGLALLGQFFKGYSVSWGGSLVGFLWGFMVGFVAGWFLAFCRNLIIAASIFFIRARSELHETRDFLDHI